MTIVTKLLPELWLLATIGALFIASVSGRKRSVLCWLPWAAVLGVIAAGVSLGVRGDLFYGVYSVDGLSQFFKLAIAAGFAIVTFIAAGKRDSEDFSPDYFMLLGVSAWGLMLLASCVELITLYLALELSSYALYALIPLRGKDRRAAEAGIKYILFGAAATAISLFGLSYIMAAKHTTYLAVLSTSSWSFADAPLAVIGLTLFLAGFFYKLALFPFHFWCPDVYQGAKNETAAYVATIPKLGAVVVLVRLAALFAPGHGDHDPVCHPRRHFHDRWQPGRPGSARSQAPARLLLGGSRRLHHARPGRRYGRWPVRRHFLRPGLHSHEPGLLLRRVRHFQGRRKSDPGQSGRPLPPGARPWP